MCLNSRFDSQLLLTFLSLLSLLRTEDIFRFVIVQTSTEYKWNSVCIFQDSAYIDVKSRDQMTEGELVLRGDQTVSLRKEKNAQLAYR